MKIETPLFMALVLVATGLATRLITEGFLPALVSTVIEYGSKLRRGRRRR
jgi:hypothetical protein